ncbi:hypothetical protein F8A86_04860 [Betaproteobacteria bacterium SCN1]|jgi:hypothetical protein|nr:hypothetical protein F8A86_04860 [Betaproteobacteria bacterium SCN1]MBN8758784.1 hypothetical protein [Thiobacillus sp.]ODU86798.1 MAG: hypothetical protein ABT21_14205 [Thiobacillus sp. SCN 65-179]OJW38550.1 MAG: hypothetical protein BGO61_13315 [Thiobacillus sp. 65-69]
MYIVAIGWAYVILLMAITAGSIGKGLAILIFLGILPIGVFVYAFGRRKPAKRSVPVSDQMSHPGDASDSERD